MSDPEAAVLQEFSFYPSEHIPAYVQMGMNRADTYDDLEGEEEIEDELNKYNLVSFAHKSYGMGCYAAIGKQTITNDGEPVDRYYFLSLGGSNGYESCENHLVAHHYSHHEECGQTLQELVKFLKEDRQKHPDMIDQCWGFPLMAKMSKIRCSNDIYNYSQIQKFFADPENENKCYICEMNSPSQ